MQGKFLDKQSPMVYLSIAMEINYFGHSCFRLSERNGSSIITDPFDASVGFSMPRLKADIVTISHDAPGHNHASAIKEARALHGAGEYEIGGVFITGVQTAAAKGKAAASRADGNTVFIFSYEDVTVCHLGDLNAILSQAEVEALGTVDILLVPVGGGNGLNAGQAAELISLIEPSIVIPMHYKLAKTKLQLDPLAKFLKEMGLTKVEPQDTFKVTKSSLPEETAVVVLEAKGA